MLVCTKYTNALVFEFNLVGYLTTTNLMICTLTFLLKFAHV